MRGQELVEALLARRVNEAPTLDPWAADELLRAAGAPGLHLDMWGWELLLVDAGGSIVARATGGLTLDSNNWDTLVVLASVAGTSPPPELLACATALLATGVVTGLAWREGRR